MKFKPMTRRFRVPGTDVVIQFAQDKDGDVNLTVDGVTGEITILLGYGGEENVIAALGFPTEPIAEDEPPVETLTEVPA